MDGFVSECQEKAGNHVNLIKFIRESCKKSEAEFVKFAISTDKLEEKVKCLILSTCFDSVEGRKLIFESLPSNSRLLEMILSEKIQKIDKEEFLTIFKKKESEEFKLKMIKKLFKHPKPFELLDELVSGNTLSNRQFYEALKFTSIEVFVKNLPRCEKSSVPWKEFASHCPEKLLAFYHSELSMSKWHEYNFKWTYISSTLSNATLNSEFYFGLLKLYENYPPYSCISGKELSEKTPNYSENLKIQFLNGLLLKKKPEGDYSKILEHFKSPESWLKKPFQEYFIQNYENILFNWDLKELEKEEMFMTVMNNVSDYNSADPNFERIPKDKFQEECWKSIFKKFFKHSQKLNIKEYSLILVKIQEFIEKSLQKIDNFKEIKDEYLFSKPLEISYFRNVLDDNLTFYVTFMKVFLSQSSEKFAKAIKYDPKNVEKLPKIVEVIEKSLNLLNSYFITMYQVALKSHNQILFQCSLIHTIKKIYELRDSALSNIKAFKLPFVTFENQIEPEFYYDREVMRDLAVRIDSELLKKEIFSDWMSNWYKTFLSYLERSLSLSNVPSFEEIDVFNAFKTYLNELCSYLPFETFKKIILKPTFEFLKKLDAFEFSNLMSHRFCSPNIKDLDCIRSLLALATPQFVFHNETLDEIFKAHLILDFVKANNNSKPGKSFENAKTENIIDSLTTIFQNYSKSTGEGTKNSSKKQLKAPNYSFLFSSSLLKHFAQKFKFLFSIKNFKRDRDSCSFTSALDKFKGFAHVLCRAIINEFTESEIDCIIEESSKEDHSFFENTFLLKLPLDGRIVKTFVNKKIARMDTLEEKMVLYRSLYSAALEQNSYELSKFDALLAVSTFIQPKIARVDWKAKSLAHPMTAYFIEKAYLSTDSPRAFTTPEHAKLVIEHLKVIWENIWSIDPRFYIHEVEKFCETIVSKPQNDIFNVIDMKLYDENIHKLVIKHYPYETIELWEEFVFDLQFNAVLRCKGAEKTQTAKIFHSNFYSEHLVSDHRILHTAKGATKIQLRQKFVDWFEEKMKKMITKYYPDMKLAPNDGKSVYNIKVCSMILNVACRFESFSPFCLDILDTISDYCRANLGDFDALQNNSSVLNDSLKIANSIDILPSLSPLQARISTWKNINLPNKTMKPHLFNDYKCSVVFLKKFVNLLDEFGHLLTNQRFPLTAYYTAKYFIYQFEEPERFFNDFQVDFFKSVIKICPSFIRTDYFICKILMEKDPNFLLDVVEANDPRLLSNGIFFSRTIPVFVIPFNDIKALNGDVQRFKEYFMKHLLNTNLALNDRVIAAKWLVNYLLKVDEIFPELYSKLAADATCGKELKKLFLKKLYNNSELEKSLNVCFSELILSDRDSIVNIFSGLASKYSGNDFYLAVYPYIDPSKEKNKEIFTTKLNFSCQKALIQLISTLNDGKVLLEFWKRREDYKEHFNMLVIKNILKVLTESKSSDDSKLFLAAVEDAIKIGELDTLKEILSVTPCNGLLDPVARDGRSIEGFVNYKIAMDFANLIHEQILEKEIMISGDLKIKELLTPYCIAWYGFEGFINDRHLSMLIKFVDGNLIEDDTKNALIKSVYNLFPLYAKFLSKKSRTDVDPYAHLNSHFQRLLSEIESSVNLDFKTKISHLQKLNSISLINKSAGKFDLTKFSTKNVHETAKYYKLSATIYENIDTNWRISDDVVFFHRK